MSSVLRVAYMLTWNPNEVAGGIFVSENYTRYVHGSGVSAISDIAETLNLTVETYFGDYFESYEMVSNGTAEMGGSLTSQDSQWSHSLAYLHALDSETSDVYFRQPTADSVFYTIIRPFSKTLWIMLLVLTTLVSFLSQKSFKKPHILMLLETVIYSIELLIGRQYIPPIRVSKVPISAEVARVIMSFFGIIILSVYVGKIASIFVIREELVKSPNDLITYKYKLNTYSNIHVHRVFENPELDHLSTNIINFTNAISFISNVIGKQNDDPRQTLFSYPDGFFPVALYSLNYNQELCTISVLKSTRKTPRSFYIRKDSLLREDINLRIVQLIERGLNHRHQINFKNKFKYFCHQQVTEFNQLTYKYVELGFIPLFTGFALAVIFELFSHFMLRKKIKTNGVELSAYTVKSV